MKILRRILCISLLVLAAFCLSAVGFYFAVTKDARLYPEKLALSEQKIVLYDSQGEPVKGVAANLLKQTVAMEEIPQKTRYAFVDTEDKRFYSHNGFDVKRIARAAVNNLKSRSFKEGASTISQQLVKNTHLSQEKTLKRKLREWKLTRTLERRYSKDEILEKYLNVIYFGHNCFGLRSAAEFYFGKTPDELDLADSAILAGLVRSPNNYSPFKNPEGCLKRKATVLNLMQKNGHITEEEKLAALEKPLPTAPVVSSDNVGYAHFVFDELTAIAESYDLAVGGNIEIRTYLDRSLQNRLEELAESYDQTDITMTVLDNRTHGFKACLSTVGEIRRLPGSVLKPLLVYAPALEKDIVSPATPVLDEKVNYGGYSPDNYDGTYSGYVSVRESVAKSLNIPAVKILETLGVEHGAEYLGKMGLPVDKDDYSLALALGGMKNGFSLQKLVSAYSTFTNGGMFCDGGFISSVKIDGKEVYKRETVSTRVFSEETSYLMTDMLQTAAKTGTAKKLRSLPFNVAAKTGTVGTSKGNTDAYALSYNTEDCVGVWLGNADNAFIDCTGGGLPCNFVLHIYEYLYKTYQEQNRPVGNFPIPSGVVRVALDKPTYYDTHNLILADDLAPIDQRFSEWFKKQAAPTKKSDIFSNPTIISPVLQYSDGKVTITFDKTLPTFYQYKIDRYDYVTHNTVYLGEFIESFTDENVDGNKNYIYTVTPIYKEIEGTPVTLPTVTTKAGEPPPTSDREILEKNWWEY